MTGGWSQIAAVATNFGAWFTFQTFDQQRTITTMGIHEMERKRDSQLRELEQKYAGQHDKINLRNNCHETIHVAVNFRALDDVWETQGWWEVEPKETMNTPVRTRIGTIYFYAESTNYRWNGKGESESVRKHIDSNAFRRVGRDFIRGKEKKRVSFFKIQTAVNLVHSLNNFLVDRCQTV